MTTTMQKPILNSIEQVKEESGNIPEILGEQVPFIILVEYEKHKRYALRYCQAQTEISQEIQIGNFAAKVISKFY